MAIQQSHDFHFTHEDTETQVKYLQLAAGGSSIFPKTVRLHRDFLLYTYILHKYLSFLHEICPWD